MRARTCVLALQAAKPQVDIPFHFRYTPGLNETPPPFVTKPPKPFDVHLPEVTVDDINHLVQIFPEMEEVLR